MLGVSQSWLQAPPFMPNPTPPQLPTFPFISITPATRIGGGTISQTTPGQPIGGGQQPAPGLPGGGGGGQRPQYPPVPPFNYYPPPSPMTGFPGGYPGGGDVIPQQAVPQGVPTDSLGVPIYNPPANGGTSGIGSGGNGVTNYSWPTSTDVYGQLLPPVPQMGTPGVYTGPEG